MISIISLLSYKCYHDITMSYLMISRYLNQERLYSDITISPTMNQLIDLKRENELTIEKRQENMKVENAWALGDYLGKSVIQFPRERN